MWILVETRGSSSSCLRLEDGEPSYVELRQEFQRLRKREAELLEKLGEARKERNEMWECVEDVACGTRLRCPTCGSFHPCMCDK